MLLRRSAFRVLAVAFFLCAAPATQAGQSVVSAHSTALAVGGSTTVPGGYTETLLAKASPDECFAGIGVNYPAGPPCPTGSQPKVNQSYVWGMTRANNTLYFGTAANVNCQVDGGYLGQTTPYQTSSQVCEFGSSEVSRLYGVPAAIGDWRPPHIYSYDLSTNTETDLYSEFAAPTNIVPSGNWLNWTLGIRSAGTLNGDVFLAGPSIHDSGINIYVLDATTGALLRVYNLTQYTDIRKWLVVNGVLYTAVQNSDGTGSVLRWTGNLPTSNPAGGNAA